MNSDRMNVGYIRSMTGDPGGRDVQAMLIQRCAEVLNLEEPTYYTDMDAVKHRRKQDVERARLRGIIDPKRSKCFPSWDKMLLMALNNEISAIIVDRKERLYRSSTEKKLIEDITRDHHIRIYEAGSLEYSKEEGRKNVAFYHYFVPNTRKKGIRTANLLKDIDGFYEMFAVHSDWSLCGLYIDCSAFKRSEINRLLQRKDVDVIVCKYFYHIKRKTLAFLEILQQMNDEGKTLISAEEGVLRYDRKWGKAISANLKVAIYDCCRSEPETETRLITKKKLTMFCKTVGIKAEKIVVYEENTRIPADAFSRLAEDAAQFDMVIIDSFAKLGESVNELMKCICRVMIPIYSLREGLLYLDGNEERI